ncbi:hypothetical protein BpHYR1_054351 [Brachionus plicatilis]|uniref:Uncharacterized protein n=1 Tax=Brachionus plicatilis TaxID=10195 RepID=A0A3M7RDZ5_BRAPC|nr:hypothetical protein BpHYR1_054351 [Brachionus plicatilis]
MLFTNFENQNQVNQINFYILVAPYLATSHKDIFDVVTESHIWVFMFNLLNLMYLGDYFLLFGAHGSETKKEILAFLFTLIIINGSKA